MPNAALPNTARIGDGIAAVVAALIYPIAYPVWFIERRVQRRRPHWRWGSYSATPYFLLLTVVATASIASGPAPVVALGLYLLTAMQLIALWLCLATAIGKPGRVLDLFVRHARRATRIHVIGTPRALYRVLVAFLFTIYFFAALAFTMHRFDPSSYRGIDAPAAAGQLTSCLYFSVVTITTLGYGDITPQAWYARASAATEALLGVLLTASYLAPWFPSTWANLTGIDVTANPSLLNAYAVRRRSDQP